MQFQRSGSWTGSRRQGRFGMLVPALLVACTATMLSPARVLAQPADVAAPVAQEPTIGLSSWGTSLWAAARSGDEQGVERLLKQMRDGEVIEPGQDLLASVKGYLATVEKREESRTKQIEKVRGEYAKALEAGEGAAGQRTNQSVIKALRALIELQWISPEKDAVLRGEGVPVLLDQAAAMARAAESAGDVLNATEIFVLLDQLYEIRGTFRADVRRMAQRQEMLRMYVPHKLWEMSNARRKLNGDKELPPYNALGDDFQQHLAGISQETVERALARTSEHIEQVPLNTLVAAGLETVRLLVTTEDLKGAKGFEGLGSETGRKAMVGAIERELKSLREMPGQIDTFQVSTLLDRVIARNDESVRLPRTAIIHEFGNGAFGKLDEYSTIIWPDEVARFRKNTEGKFVGVGIQIEFDELQNVRVVTPIEGTPAQRAGVHPGDFITKVNGKSIFGLSLDQVVDQITGPSGTSVVLTIDRPIKDASAEVAAAETKEVIPAEASSDKPDAAPAADAAKPKPDVPKETMEFRLTRAIVEVPSVKGWVRNGPKETDWDFFVDRPAEIGYVRLTQFADDTTDQLDTAVRQMKRSGLKALIVDLRYNPGGLLDQAVSVAQRLLPFDGEPIVSARRSDRKEKVEGSTDADLASLSKVPVIVLVNEGSASASEIVSGAVSVYSKRKDLDALVLGARSFGKGSVQNVWPMQGGTTILKLTTAYYMLPDKSIIHKRPGNTTWGVEPNLHVEMLPEQNSQAIQIRRQADVLPLNENGVSPSAKQTLANPNDALTKGIDLQLQAAITVLKARLAGENQSLASKADADMERSRTP
jgi:carboxyl-terminal processing protease